MPSVLAFDTHAYVKKLRDAGVPEAQAEVQIEALATLLDERMASRRDLAELKRDVKELETTTETRFKELETTMETRFKELETTMKTRFKELETTVETRFKDVDTKLKELESRLLIRLGSLGVLGIGVVATLVKIL